MTQQPRLRVKTKHNTHMYMMTIKPDEFNHDYTLTVPSTPFRKDFVDNELWGQMRIYNDTYDTTISCTALCLDAEYNVLAEYFQNTEYDGVVPFECELSNNKAFTLSDESVTRIHFLSPSNMPVGNYIRAILLDGGDFPLTNQSIHYYLKQTNGVDYTGDIVTDNKGICTIPHLLDSGKYKIVLTYNGADIENVHYNNCSKTKWIEMDGLHNTSVSIMEDYYTTQNLFRMVKTEASGQIEYSKSLKAKRIWYVTGSDLYVKLTDKEENSHIKNETLNLQVDGRTYTATTNEDGIAFFQIYLDNGDYPMTLRYKGSNYYNSCESKVNYILCARKNKSVKITCANKYEDKSGKTWQCITKGGNLRFTLKENVDSSIHHFDGDNFYERLENGKTVFYKDPTFTTKWINGTDDTELLNATLRTQSFKDYNNCVTISSEANHLRELTYSGSYDGVKYIKAGTQKAKSFYGITIGVPQKTSPDSYAVKVEFKGDNYFNKLESIFKIQFKHTGSSATDKSSTSINLPYTKSVMNSKHLTFRLRSEFNEYLKGKMLSFTVDNETYSSKIGNDGLVSFPKSLDVGKHTITVKFAGDTCFKSCSAKFTFNVLKEKAITVIDEPIKYLANFNSHLVIPEDINSYTEHIQFIYTLTVEEQYEIEQDSVHVYFNNFMLNTGDYRIDYIQADEKQDIVNFTHSYYALLYSNYNENRGIEVIRPNKANFTTKQISKNEHTILSPFFKPSIREDKPANICKEYLNFHHQTINISQDNQ